MNRTILRGGLEAAFLFKKLHFFEFATRAQWVYNGAFKAAPTKERRFSQTDKPATGPFAKAHSPRPIRQGPFTKAMQTEGAAR
ncbi:hypothetical protein [Allorhizobium undicola]|uniref:hypothetical protein n=1 Tax=Allorhizobium undicola TaxID=78527 RepID=UPI0004889635|nr:hypothetical protein [Allorhizobium undicola]